MNNLATADKNVTPIAIVAAPNEVEGGPDNVSTKPAPIITMEKDLGLVHFKVNKEGLSWETNPAGVKYYFMRVSVGGNFVPVHLYGADEALVKEHKGRNILVKAKLMKKQMLDHYYIFADVTLGKGGTSQGVLKFHDLRFTPEASVPEVKFRLTFEGATNAGALTIRVKKPRKIKNPTS